MRAVIARSIMRALLLATACQALVAPRLQRAQPRRRAATAVSMSAKVLPATYALSAAALAYKATAVATAAPPRAAGVYVRPGLGPRVVPDVPARPPEASGNGPPRAWRRPRGQAAHVNRLHVNSTSTMFYKTTPRAIVRFLSMRLRNFRHSQSWTWRS